jgi:hypothetical protein
MGAADFGADTGQVLHPLNAPVEIRCAEQQMIDGGDGRRELLRASKP